MDAILAALLLLIWILPPPAQALLFEILTGCLAAELAGVFVLLIVTKHRIPDTRRELRVDWNWARGVASVPLLYYVATGALDWKVFLFIVIVLLTANFPLRIAAHDHWREQLNVDTWIMIGIIFLAGLIGATVRFPPLPPVALPADGIVHDLVFDYRFHPQAVLVLGALYFVPKALLNNYRFVTDHGPVR